VATEWLAVLDDDDLYLPHHFAAIAPHLDSADVLYTLARVGPVSRTDVTDWTNDEITYRLASEDCIPSNAAIRTEVARSVGGWSDDGFDFTARRFTTGATTEDWDMWIRLAKAGARFRCVPTETWDYRSGDWDQTSSAWSV
jgi:hypothetical protein